MKRIFFLLCLFAGTGMLSASAAPALFFTDLTSGPVGAIVTVYGSNLQPAVTLNGVSATVVASSANKVSFIVPSTASGSIAMSGSNGIPFTVRGGHIYYVATNGSDSNAGSQSSPWATIPHAFNTAACGDVIYAMNGVSQTGLDNYGASLSVQRKCTQNEPLALVGYPGAIVTIGSTGGQEFGIRNPDVNGDGYNGMVFANLVLRGNNTALKDVNNEYWRIVGNDFSCPNGGGQAACVHLDVASYVQFLGNSIHDTGAGNTKYYHSFYGTTNTNHIDVGWNHIYNNKSCRGVQFYSTSGSPQYDLIVHDNVITGQQCDGINFSTVDATLGPVKAYNNLVYHVGVGGPNLNTPNEACIASLGYGAPGGEAVFYGNTMVDCGSAGGSTAGAITVLTGSPTVVLMSNLVAQNAGEVIYSPNTNQSLIAASYNVLLTQGTAGVLNSSYQLVAGSPAIGAGTAYSGMLRDLAGLLRPQSGKQDAGAYLYSTSSAPSSGPTATLSTGAMSFGNQTVNTTSSAHSATLSNSGTSTLSISKIAVSGTNASSFVLSHNCGTSLAAGQSCVVQVQFKPATTGALTGAITFTDNSSNPSQSIALSGTGISTASPAISVTPINLTFASQNVNTTSTAQLITVKNTGTAGLSLSGLNLSGVSSSAFKVTNGCAATLAAGVSCTIQIQFAPTAEGTMTASLALASNASSSPQAISLTGTAVNPTSGGTNTSIHLSRNNLYFYNRAVNSISAPSSILITNTGKAALTVRSLTLTGAQPTSFLASSTCGSTVAVGASCTINVSFVPRITGTNTASLILTYNGSPSTLSIPLVGHGF
jgi:Abnormal spindle-like microcephaly-assoc'd, ASPM-SPD-2-Hydin